MQKILIDEIRIDGGTQPRAQIDAQAVSDYTEAIGDGVELPPVIVFNDGASKWLADGFHRYHAHRNAGKVSIAADLRSGTQRDAILFSVGANSSHGLRRSNADKQKAVDTLLADAEWGAWSDSAIAKACGVHHSTVALHRKSLAESASEKPVERTYTSKHGTTATMNTAKIGKTGPVVETVTPIAESENPCPQNVDEPPAEDIAAALAEEEAQAQAERETLEMLIASDDKLATAVAEVKSLKALTAQLQLRINGLIGEVAEATKQAKKWKKLADKAAKVAA